jgi:hypothetical protein
MRRRPLAGRGAFLLLAALTVVACADDDPANPGAHDVALPPVMDLNGVAEIVLEDGRTASCAVFLHVELQDEGVADGDALIYRATAGGDAVRTVLEADGSGFSFWPHLHSGATVRATQDSIELMADGYDTVTERFYQGVMHFRAARTGESSAEGTWTCAPLDLDSGGWLDTAVVAPGSFEIEQADG